MVVVSGCADADVAHLSIFGIGFGFEAAHQGLPAFHDLTHDVYGLFAHGLRDNPRALLPQVLDGPLKGFFKCRAEVLGNKIHVVQQNGVGRGVNQGPVKGFGPFRFLIQIPVAFLPFAHFFKCFCIGHTGGNLGTDAVQDAEIALGQGVAGVAVVHCHNAKGFFLVNQGNTDKGFGCDVLGKSFAVGGKCRRYVVDVIDQVGLLFPVNLYEQSFGVRVVQVEFSPFQYAQLLSRGTVAGHKLESGFLLLFDHDQAAVE